MWYIILALYIVLGILSYVFVFNKWDKPVFDKVWFAIFWPAVLVAWVFHKVYNNLKTKE